MPDYSLFPATKGNQFSFNDFRTALDVGNNQPISFADLYPGGVYIPDDNNFFTFLLSVPDTGEVSINDFQKNGTSLADFTISTPDANNHVEDQTTRNLATISLNNGTFTEGQRIYYELEPSTGSADPDFTGELKVILFNHGSEPFVIKKGNRIAQMILERCETPLIEEVEELKQTQRGERGFGSSGN